MRFHLLVPLLSILALVGCQNLEQEIMRAELAADGEGYCVMTATSESDGRFLMLDELFSRKIACETDDDCYELLRQADDYRRLDPEFEPYLNCEESVAETVG